MTVWWLGGDVAVGGRGGGCGHFGGDGAGLEAFDGQVDAERELPHGDRECREPGPHGKLVVDPEVLCDDGGEDDGRTDEAEHGKPPGDEAGFVHQGAQPVSYTHLRAHETVLDLVCRLLLEK